MVLRKPTCFDGFRCIAGDCPDSCCQEWDVDVDDASARRYLTLPGDLGVRIREKLKNQGEGYYLEITNRRCPMWRSDGLCQIQYELGEAGLCQVCRQFPRLRHDYGDFVELGLELSCPEAARILLTQPWDMISEEVSGGEEPEYDREMMEILLRSREKAWELLDREPLSRALCLLLLYAHRVQGQLDGDGEFDFVPEEELVFARTHAEAAEPEGLRRLYLGLEILTPRWRELLSGEVEERSWGEYDRAFLRYGIGRYWLQAVSDYDLIGRVKFLISACVLLRTLPGNPVAVAQLWSKEIENSTENVEALLDAAYESPAMTDVHLLGLLVW